MRVSIRFKEDEEQKEQKEYKELVSVLNKRGYLLSKESQSCNYRYKIFEPLSIVEIQFVETIRSFCSAFSNKGVDVKRLLREVVNA